MFAGIDISKNWVDVAVAESADRLRRAEPEKAAQWLAERGIRHAVLEATGGYERPMIEALHRAGIAVSRINPRQARAFAQALGSTAKTDVIDAENLAIYAKALTPDTLSNTDESRKILQEILARRQDLVQMRTQEKNRLAQQRSPLLRQQIEQMISLFDEQIRQLECAMRQHLQAHPLLSKQAAQLTTMPGIGFITSLILIAFLPELGQIPRNAIASLVGVAPHPRQSGQWKGKNFCSGGRAVVRNALYMAAVANLRRENRFRKHYQHLIQKGKPPKVALVAIMRKMLITLNTLIKNNTHFIP
jgi:transposase